VHVAEDTEAAVANRFKALSGSTAHDCVLSGLKVHRQRGIGLAGRLALFLLELSLLLLLLPGGHGGQRRRLGRRVSAGRRALQGWKRSMIWLLVVVLDHHVVHHHGGHVEKAVVGKHDLCGVDESRKIKFDWRDSDLYLVILWTVGGGYQTKSEA